MKYRKRVIALIAFFTLAAAVSRLSAQEPTPGPGGRRGNMREFLGLGPAPDPAAAKKGEPLYKQNCGGCHGQDARGAQAPNLVRSPIVLHDEKGETLAPIIKSGKENMPAFPNLSPDDIYNISQYIHLQVELTANRGTYNSTYAGLRGQATGDAKKGEAFFKGAGGCTSCHSATGDLAKIGAKLPQAALLKSRFLWPATPGPAKANVTTPAGQIVAG